jgi:hypothetical protein
MGASTATTQEGRQDVIIAQRLAVKIRRGGQARHQRGVDGMGVFGTRHVDAPEMAVRTQSGEALFGEIDTPGVGHQHDKLAKRRMGCESLFFLFFLFFFFDSSMLLLLFLLGGGVIGVESAQ